MNEGELKFDRDEIIKYLINQLISTKSRLLALEMAFYAYIYKHDGEKEIDVYQKAVTDQEKKSLHQALDDLRVLDQGLSDLLNKELNDLKT